MGLTTATARQPIESIMTRNPICVGGATPASELAILLDENEISGAPVIDLQDRIIGVVSKTDLLHRCVEGPLGSRPGSFLSSLGEGLGGEFDTETLGLVSEFMNPEPITATPNESVSTVARRMGSERVHRVVIVDEHLCVLGVVTSLDMLKVIAT